MKKNFVLFILILVSALNAVQIFAGGKHDDVQKYDSEHFEKAVQKILQHKIEPYEQSIIETTYLYYYEKNEHVWTKTSWEGAVSKAAELCNDRIAVAAAKAGKFGEKVLKAIIVTTEDALNSLNRWVEDKSSEYDSRK